MYYQAFSLNGAWEMDYIADVYKGEENPWTEGYYIPNAVPGYWEDMTEQFRMTHLFGKLRMNPEYGLQCYPIAEYVPDMALPNIVGTCFYRRNFSWEKTDREVELYFGGVQNAVSVWLNDRYIGRHEGYSAPFAMKIPADVLQAGENTLVLSVSNDGLTGYNDELVSGLTNRASNQYTGGIYGDVELRVYAAAVRDAVVLISEDCTMAHVQIDGEVGNCQWEVLDGKEVLFQGTADGDFSFSTEKLEKWSPEQPNLYTLRLAFDGGEIQRTFGVRRLLAKGLALELNGEPCYLRGICEHCYYPLEVHPSQDVKFYRDVIKKLKELDFNFIRFHTHIPPEAYMQAADELGMLIEVESPNNTSQTEWAQIVEFCRRHPSVVIYCCGNERMIDEPFLAHLRICAEAVHQKTDGLFSPMSALRGLEYMLIDPARKPYQKEAPFHHDFQRFEVAGEFTDLYNSFTLSNNSYETLKGDWKTVDAWSEVYGKPRLSHEICIHGTYTDLSLKDRYAGTRVGETLMFSSLEKHLADKGVLEKAPVYFQNSCQWQWRARKHCFETMRLSRTVFGYDFLGPIDTHWHTFGYDVGMMNEFYEMKPGETVRNVRMYNGATVLMADLGTNFNFYTGSQLSFGLHISHFGKEELKNAVCNVRLMQGQNCAVYQRFSIGNVKKGSVEKLLDVTLNLPDAKKPQEYKLYITLEAENAFVENEWEIYTFPRVSMPKSETLLIRREMTAKELNEALEQGKDVLLLGGKPFQTAPTTYQVALAGRTEGNLATVIADHPVLKDLPHSGYCGWQFRHLMEGGEAVRFESDKVPFNPIIEMVSSHKYVIRQAALFEAKVGRGRLLVCGLRFDENDPAANWLKARLIAYASGDEFAPETELDAEQVRLLIETKGRALSPNANLALNPNDKTAQ